MDLLCLACQKVHKIDLISIPADGATTICSCGHSFKIPPPNSIGFFCPKCGHEQEEGEECKGCGVIFRKMSEGKSDNEGIEQNQPTSGFEFGFNITTLGFVFVFLIVLSVAVSEFRSMTKKELTPLEQRREEAIQRANQVIRRNEVENRARVMPSYQRTDSASDENWNSASNESKRNVCMEFVERGTGRRDLAVAYQLQTCIDGFFRGNGSQSKRITEVAANCLVLMGYR